MKKIIVIPFAMLALLILIQCKSAPVKVEPLPEPPAVVIPEPVVEKREIPEIKTEEMEIAVKPSLNLRTAGGLHGRIINSIPYGRKITVLDRIDDEMENRRSKSKWFKVEFDGQAGYVNSKYLREIGDDRIVRTPRSIKRRRRARKAPRKSTSMKPESVEPTPKLR